LRFLILSDVHANWEALWTFQQAERKPDAVLFLGDVVGLGADADRCATWLRSNATYAISGDHDAALFDADELFPGSRVCCGVDATIEYAAHSLSSGSRDYIASLPDHQTVKLADCTFHLTHAGPTGLFDRYDLMSAPKELLEAEVKTIAADVCSSDTRTAPASGRFWTRSLLRRAAWALRATVCRMRRSPRGRTGRFGCITCTMTTTRRRTSWTRFRWMITVGGACSNL